MLRSAFCFLMAFPAAAMVLPSTAAPSPADGLTAVRMQWAMQIRDIVRNHWRRPKDGRDDFRCKVQMKLMPNGVVLDAHLVKHCGGSELEKSVVAAAYESSPFPLPADPAAFEPDLFLTLSAR